MILCSKKSINQDDIGDDVNILKSDYLTHWLKVSECENELKDFFNINYATSDSNNNRGSHL